MWQETKPWWPVSYSGEGGWSGRGGVNTVNNWLAYTFFIRSISNPPKKSFVVHLSYRSLMWVPDQRL